MTNRKNNEALAYEQVKRAIMLKKLVGGQRVTEDWVSKELKMSRTPIRAAFKRLENEGLIQLVPNKGAIVYNPSDKELEDVFNLRVVLEKYAAELALVNMRDEDVVYMENLLKREKEAYKAKDFEAFMEVNGLIHSYPAEISGNNYLLQEIKTLNQWTDGYLILKDDFYITPFKDVKSIPEHTRVVDAFKKKDVDAMGQAIEDHLLSTLKDLSDRPSIFN
ncbi:GntR family transcriptional regulator [Halobacillus sp. BBL2006]|uniref:GntR family transcriptional regulator n=1 Tax=Halobacillus sp. BBL2006 TaxID=1543706 RepID=UPI00054447BD|nr:GntR family transcriptional regulator [Halobacillus sp. BBL2006]KHE71551.1 GntR family transcriptional regulator [Halobacillus sp. BBL2006]